MNVTKAWASYDWIPKKPHCSRVPLKCVWFTSERQSLYFMRVLSQVTFRLHPATSLIFPWPSIILHTVRGVSEPPDSQGWTRFWVDTLCTVENETENLVHCSLLSVGNWDELARGPKLVDTHGPRDTPLSQLGHSVSWSYEKWERRTPLSDMLNCSVSPFSSPFPFILCLSTVQQMCLLKTFF